MSAIGTLHIVPAASLLELETASFDGSPAVLEKVQIESIVYQYDGWVLATLLPALAVDYGINLMNSHRELAAKLSPNSGNSQFIFTQVERDACLNRLDATLFSEEKLQQAYEAFNQIVADGVGDVMLEGISFLQAGLQQVTPETVAILTIG